MKQRLPVSLCPGCGAPAPPLAEHNVRPIIRPASTAERLATLQKSVDQRHHDNKVLLWIHPTQSCLTSVMCHHLTQPH